MTGPERKVNLGCPFCAIVLSLAGTLIVYCAIAWWFLAEPSPAFPDREPPAAEAPKD